MTANDRNRPDLEGTSQLSPCLRFGMLSARQAVVAAQARGGPRCTSMLAPAAKRG